MDEKDVPHIRFRGGVRYTSDDKKWHIIIEINGTSYLDEAEFDTEEEAMVVYREARQEIIKGLGIATGPDLEFQNPIHCPWCHVTFTKFDDYDGHLPCKLMPPEKAE